MFNAGQNDSKALIALNLFNDVRTTLLRSRLREFSTEVQYRHGAVSLPCSFA